MSSDDRDEAEPLLTAAELAAMFRVDPKTITRWAKAGKLASIRTLGGHRRYRETEIRALLAGIPALQVEELEVSRTARSSGGPEVPVPRQGDQSIESVEIPDEISVSIYLDTDDETTIDRVVRYVDELVGLLGYLGPIGSKTRRGSFVRDSWSKISSLTSNEAKELAIQTRRAIEIIALDRQQAEVDNKIADTVSKIITSLEDVPSAFIRTGSLLLIKNTGPNGSEISIRQLTQLEIRALERFPGIQQRPQTALESLALALDDLKEA